jgi:soluble lytic murein transglycosylase-like protein
MIRASRALFVLAILAAAPATADAQIGVPGARAARAGVEIGVPGARAARAGVEIYTWRDGAGNLVLSDRPKDPSAETYRVVRTGLFRTTPPMSRRASQFDGLIEEHAAAHAVSPALVRAVIQAESAFNPRARSHKGAMGLMQLMPGTAAQFEVLDPYDPTENIRAGVTYLKQLLVKYEHNESLALAAYNAGPAAVARYGAIPPYKETRNYVEKIRRATAQPAGPRTRIYRIVEVVDGREVVRFSDVPAPGGQVVKSAERH